MKKSLILALVAVVFACVARAVDVTSDMAMTAANAWVARNAAFGAGGSAQSVRTVCDTNAAHTVLWHQVSMSGGGCLIVAPVTEIEPVLAALEDDPGEIPAAHPLRALLTADLRSRLRFLKLYAEDASSSGGGMNLLSASPAAEDENTAVVRGEWSAQQKSKWRKLGVSSGGFQLMEAESVGVKDPIDVEIRVVEGFEKGGNLTHWNQSNAGGGKCFNYYTPNNAVCGCVATACSAALQFFKTAAGPEGYENTCTYNGVAGTYTTKGGDYDWSILPSNWGGEADASSSLTDEQRELLGRVAYDAGVCLGMMWTDGESGAYTRDIAAVMRDNFGFQHAVLVDRPKLEQYHKLIYMQCWAGAPVVMGIQGHAVVACGYGKDSEGVPRARVFMGWGGSGDAWYALPQIDTQSVLGGSTYLSEVISCVITMIGYEDDNVIPVCGQIIPSLNATVECGDDSVEANENGYFGLRISAATTAGEVVPVSVTAGSATKSGSVVLGAPATPTSTQTYAYNGAAVCSWIPNDILITLLNSETASTFAEAKEKALATIGTDAPKAILAFSGTWGEQATDAAWDYLYSIDEANTDDFTSKYVVLCTPYSLSGTSASDGNPSFAVFDPRALTVDPDKFWSFYNGRLSYWTIGGAICTNDEALVAAAATNVVQNGSLPTYVTSADVVNGFISVLENGRTNFLADVSGVTLEVVGSGDGAGAVEPAYGVHAISAGEAFTATAPSVATNKDENIEFACKGWELSSTNSDEVVSGTGTTATFTPVPNGAYTLTWLWEPNAVKIDVAVIEDSRYGTVEPGSGWFPYGEPVTFTATPAAQSLTTYYYFKDWDHDNQDGDDFVESDNQLTFTVVRPLTVNAQFGKGNGTPPPPLAPATNVFDIVWNDDLNNLSAGYATNLLSASALSINGCTKDDLTVTAPPGWNVSVATDADGNAVATLARDDAALEAAMATCSLTVIPNDDETLTVKATISGGLRGFWYVLYGSDDLATWEAVKAGTYESGTPAAQAQGSAEKPVDKVELSITVTPGNSAAGIKRFYKVVSGATKTPLAE